MTIVPMKTTAALREEEIKRLRGHNAALRRRVVRLESALDPFTHACDVMDRVVGIGLERYTFSRAELAEARAIRRERP